MSTSAPVNGPSTGDHKQPSRGLSLPTFVPIRSSSHDDSEKAESSASGSLRSYSNGASSPDIRPRVNLPTSYSVTDNHSDHNAKPSGHRRNRSSGGFLLDPVANPSGMSHFIHAPSPRDVKGKRKGNASELSIPKRRLRNFTASKRGSIGSSPLATEIKPDYNGSEVEDKDILIPGTDIRRQSRTPKPPTHGTPDVSRPSGDSYESRQVGFNSDPAQIVHMALTLSERRRRQASEKRYISSDLNNRRAISTSSPLHPQSGAQTSSIGQYLTPSRLGSRKGSPQPKTTNSAPLQQGRENDKPALPDQDPLVSTVPDMMDLEISSATVARVEKAKLYFELAYEHRRLLSHLPPVRRPGTTVKPLNPDAQSKAYNPLQYVRNRKLRFWENTAINSESEGWHDIEKVRAWVDAVVTSHTETRHDPEECVRLPPLNPKADSPAEQSGDLADSPASSTQRPHDTSYPKPRRPRSDWVTHPGDIIADAQWLEQGMNKMKIQDRDGNQIYPQNTRFRFSGWGNQTPIDMQQFSQEPTPPPEQAQNDQSPELPVSALPELPTFKSAHDRNKSKFHSRLHKPEVINDGGGLRRRTLKLFDESSDSDTSATSRGSDEPARRGRKRFSRKRQNMTITEGRPAALHNLTDTSTHSLTDPSQSPSGQNSKRASVDLSRFGKLLGRENTKNPTPSTPLRRAQSARPAAVTRSSIEQDRLPRNSLDSDTTVPNSPTGTGFPSIAINLSPPPSRSSSPTKKPLPSILHPFRDRNKPKRPDNGRDRVDTTDFAALTPKPESRASSSEVETHQNSSGPTSRGQSPMTRGHSPFSVSKTESAVPDDLQAAIGDHDIGPMSRVSTKSTALSSSEHPGRIRGIFKGGRIAEIVGNEVSRVGDFIWKREPPSTHRYRTSASDSSLKSYDDSESEDNESANGHTLKTLPLSKQRSSSSVASDGHENTLSPTVSRSSTTGGEKHQYHNPNLPTFTSPFQLDRDQQDRKKEMSVSTGSSQNLDTGSDHISRLAAQHREMAKSPRPGHLAPPRLNIDTTGGSPSLSRRGSYGFGLDRSRSASRSLNQAVGDRTPSGRRRSRSNVDMSRQFTLSTSNSPSRGELPIITKRDITRAEALLLSSAVKAREIVRRADSVRPPPKFLLDTILSSTTASEAKLHAVKRKEEHIIAARNLMSTLSVHSTKFNHQLRTFTSTLAPALHKELQILEDMVENTMTPRVRSAADEAGELSMKLTTTSTLAVRGLNDSIDVAQRRRKRGPVRWVRRLGYTLIEWAVVGLLWAIWAVVTLVRGAMAMLKCVARVGRWLVWLV